METTNVRHQLLCVQLNISCWEARRQDKKVNREVAEAHGTPTSVGRYHKDLLPDCEEHQAILKIRNAWRVWHYDQTLPWGNDGSRVIRSAAAPKALHEVQGRADECSTSTTTFWWLPGILPPRSSSTRPIALTAP